MGPFEPPDFRDPDNPYAPPQSAFVPEPISPLQVGMPFSAADVFDRSWSIFKTRMGDCMAIFWGPYGLNLAVGLGANLLIQAVILTAPDSRLLIVLGFIAAYVVSWVINLWLLAGQSRAFIKIARDQPVSFGEVFQGGRYVLTMIFATICFMIGFVFVFALGFGLSAAGLGILGNQSAGGIAFLTIGIAATVLLVVYMMARCFIFFYVIVDRDADAIDSLVQSWQLTRNRGGTIILVFFLAFAIYLAGILALCVGIVFSAPLAVVMFAVTYVALVPTGSPPPEKAELIWEDEL
jgi:hypothetical protein